MVIINLRQFYPWYQHDDYLEVQDEIAAVLFAERRRQKSYERTVRRERLYSLDTASGMEADSIISYNDSPERVFAMMDRYCRLCRALNSLPAIQARRLEAHYLHGVSQRTIARTENVSRVAVSVSIMRGLAALRKYFGKFSCGV